MKFLYILLSCICINISAQNAKYSSLNGHSHNDYEQKYPFKTAFEAKMGSIEADVFLGENELFVAHEKKAIKAENTLNTLYLKPLSEAFKNGKIYPLVLLIDIKSNADSTLLEIVRQLANYPEVFNEKSLVKVVISGNRPKPQNWLSYPNFIQFDGRPKESYTPEQWQRVGMVSDNFKNYTIEGHKNITDAVVSNKMKEMIATMHAKGKTVRFWETADKKKVWKTLMLLGADFINTDVPDKLKKFLTKTNSY